MYIGSVVGPIYVHAYVMYYALLNVPWMSYSVDLGHIPTHVFLYPKKENNLKIYYQAVKHIADVWFVEV